MVTKIILSGVAYIHRMNSLLMVNIIMQGENNLRNAFLLSTVDNANWCIAHQMCIGPCEQFQVVTTLIHGRKRQE